MTVSITCTDLTLRFPVYGVDAKSLKKALARVVAVGGALGRHAGVTDVTALQGVNLQLKAEFFNIFNHPNFSSPILPNFIADPGTPNFDPTLGPLGRQLGSYALTATGDVGIGNPFLGGGGPRGVQFSASIKF